MTVNVQVVDRGEGPRSLNDSLKIPSETGFGKKRLLQSLLM